MFGMIGKYSNQDGGLLVKYGQSEWEEVECRDEKGNAIIFSGEIYNLLGLCSDLKKSEEGQIQNLDTTEGILLKYYTLFGMERLLNQINGIFAIIIFDRNAKRLYLIRDHMGIFPLYYYESNKQILFSSEVKLFLECGVAPKLSYEGLFSYLANQSVDEPYTLIKKVKAVSAGSFVVADGTGVKSPQIYWDAAVAVFEKYKGNIPDSFNEAGDKLKDLLLDAIKIRNNGGKRGILLSGGIDSSAIVALSRQLDPVGRIDTFTCGYEKREYDEKKYAHLVAKENKAIEHMLFITGDFIKEYLSEALDNEDQPTLDGINTFFSSKMIKELGFDTVVSGLGGEFFVEDDIGVYLKLQRYVERFQYVPNCMGKFLDCIAMNRKFRTAAQCISAKDAYFVSQRIRSDAEIEQLVDNDVIKNHRREMWQWEEIANREIVKNAKLLPDAIARKYYLESKTWHVSTLLKDVMQNSWGQGLKTQFPLMDFRLVEYLFSLPLASKADFKTSKIHLVNASNGKIPKECIYRTKMGFVFPLAEYFRNELKDEMEGFYLGMEASPLFNHRTLKRIWNKFINRQESWTIVWKLYRLDRWIKKWNIEL